MADVELSAMTSGAAGGGAGGGEGEAEVASAVDVASLVAGGMGETVRVPVRRGGGGNCACVTVSGDASLPYSLVTYADVCTGHEECFGSLTLCVGKGSLLRKHARVYHIDPPGHGADADADTDGSTSYSLEDLAGDVADVVDHFGIKSNVLLLGAGAGAHVLAVWATHTRTPRNLVLGGLFLSPAAKKCSWSEWAWATAAVSTLRSLLPGVGGWQPWLVDSVLKRWFSARARGIVSRTDLARGAAQRMTALRPAAAAAYISALARREDITARLKNFRGRAVVVAGSGCYDGGQTEALDFRAACAPQRSVWIEVEGSGALVSEERPDALLRPLHLFLQAVGVIDPGVPMPAC